MISKEFIFVFDANNIIKAFINTDTENIRELTEVIQHNYVLFMKHCKIKQCIKHKNICCSVEHRSTNVFNDDYKHCILNKCKYNKEQK